MMFEREHQLTLAEIERIEVALLKAYANRKLLYARMRTKWGVNADDVVNTDQPGTLVIADLVEWAKTEGRLLDLVALAWTDGRENNQYLAPVAAQLLGDLTAVREQYALPPLFAAAPPAIAVTAIAQQSLEKIVKDRSRFTDVTAFIDRLQLLSHAICRITAASSLGTGFLIGRQTVLTNYHVAKAALEEGVPGNQVICEFDIHGASVGWTGHAIDPILLNGLHSRYSPSDLTGTGEPLAGSLDFAVIRLTEPVEPERRAIVLPSIVPIVAPLDPIAVVQHPGGQEMQIAWGSVLEYPASGLRYRYDATTIGGSSGSPVMSADLELIALHHAADPATQPRYNQGVPIWRIAKALADAGVTGDAL